MPNTIETVEAFIASSSLGAIWSSCSPDFGVKGVVERFSQINPKVLFVVDKYFYNGKTINVLERVPQILKEIPSIKYVVIVNYPGEKYLQNKYKFKKVKVLKWSELMKKNLKRFNFLNLILSKSLQFYIQVELLENQSVYVIEVEEFYFNIKKNINFIVILKKVIMFFILLLVDG